MEEEEPILLDKILLELGCFNQLPCRTQLNNICRLALKPRDTSATMVDANDSEKSGSTLSMGEALTKLNNCKTLMLHNFKDSPLSDHKKAYNRALTSSYVKRLCLSNCSNNEDTVSILENVDVEILIIWNCNFGSLPTALPSLKWLMVVDSYIRKGAIERTLRSSGYLERVVLIRAGNMPNHEKEESYYLSPDYYCAPSIHHHHRHIRLCTLSQALLHSKITTLILERNIIPTPNLAYAIQNHLYLKKLSLNETIISDAFALWLAQALQKNTTLEELDLKQVRWSPIGAMTIADSIRSNTTLRCLDLSETMWHDPQSKEALGQTIRENSTLEHVQLNRLHDLPREGSTILSYIFQALKVNETIASISLAGNYIHHQGHPSLVRMDFSKSSSPSGWGDALLGLATNSTLRDISLEYCCIGNKGAVAIGKILASNHSLQSIDLCHNEIDSDGCYTLVHGLKNSQSLKRIYLHGNSIDESCSMVIRDAMRDHNRSLRVIFWPSSHLQEELQYYGSINFAGRKYIGDLTLKHSISIWPLILQCASQHPDMLLFLVKQNPDLFQRKVSSKKRSLDDLLSK
jgi:hypothetical protein